MKGWGYRRASLRGSFWRRRTGDRPGVGRAGRSSGVTALMAHEAFRKMENTPLVFIAAIAGHCLGGGLELALACDMRFASEGSYQIGLPEVNLGLFPGSGGTQRLPRLVGLSKGLDLIANATTLKPAEAKDVGIIDRLFPDAAACRAGARKNRARAYPRGRCRR